MQFRSLSSWIQLAFFFTIIFLLVMGLITLSLQINSILLVQYIQEYSREIGMKQNTQSIEQSFENQLVIYSDMIQLHYRTLDSIKVLGQHLDKSHLNQNSSCQCPPGQGYTLGYRQSNICWTLNGILYGQVLNKSIQSVNQKYLNLIGILQTVLPIFDVEKFAVSNWSLSSIKTNIFAANEASGFSSSVNMKSRPYVQDHLAHPNHQFVFSNVFFSLGGIYKVTITTNLTYESGIAAVQLNFAQFEQRLQKDFFIVQLNGQILFGASNFGYQGVLYFYNESITGFDYEDWVQVRQQIFTNQSVSNCNKATKYLCRHNNQLQKELMLYVILEEQTEYLIVILKDIEIDLNLKQQISFIESDIQAQITQIICYQGYLSLILIIVSSLVINALFFDLNHMVRHCKQHIFQSLSQGNLLTPNYFPRRIRNNNLIHHLIRIFYIRLRHQRRSQYRKSYEAFCIEELIYPRDIIANKRKLELSLITFKFL